MLSYIYILILFVNIIVIAFNHQIEMKKRKQRPKFTKVLTADICEEDYKYFKTLFDTHLDLRDFQPKNIPQVKSKIDKWITPEMKSKYMVAFGDSPSVCLR